MECGPLQPALRQIREARDDQSVQGIKIRLAAANGFLDPVVVAVKIAPATGQTQTVETPGVMILSAAD